MFFYNVYNWRRGRMSDFVAEQQRDGNEKTYLLPRIAEEGENEGLFLIPQRYLLGIMGFLAVVNAYTMRVTLSVAITEMVAPIPHNDMYNDQTCTLELSNNSKNSIINDNLYHWTSKQQGLILSSFYWGYVITHIPGGIIAEKFGGKYSLGLGILCTAIFTFITPFVIYATDGNWVWVVVVRVIEGLGEGTTFPALTTLLANWVPLSERSKIGTLVYAGSQIGTVVGNSVSGALIASTQDWASVFYVFGALGILWVIIWMMLCYSDPESHPFITEKEKKYLNEEIANVSSEKKRIPWKALLTSMPLWALVTAQIGHDWGFFTMVTDLPKYMKDVLHFNVKQNGVWSSVPYIFMWIVSMSSGWLCDWLIKKNIMMITTARKFFTTLASMGPALFIILASYSGCDRTLAVTMFTLAMGCMGTFYCGMKVNALDLSPNYAGAIMAVVNGIGGLTGIIVPYLVGALTENHTLLEWRLVFWIAFGVFFVTNLAFVLFGSGEVQTWNNSEKKPDVEKNSKIAEEKC
ncbi:putative inorganic phosphate cotransporter isoform X2 [Aethina tumida]|uniref:putative inorganic phosphate cotransporter isoform X2 n=1 Tax=Aethina tumida TaxID=116153 RepID=UPI0021481524|nr:putative inorganic phosphate cotransporter isoform X2 [Aethina tumida]